MGGSAGELAWNYSLSFVFKFSLPEFGYMVLLTEKEGREMQVNCALKRKRK